MSELRDWLERLGASIPGYGGYAERERRRDIDKLSREHLADRLRAVKNTLTGTIGVMTSSGRLMEVGPVDRAMKKVDRIENRVRFASYGYSGFFDATRIGETELDALHAFDLSLVQKAEALESKARELESQASGGGDIKAAAAEVERAVDELNNTFDKRYEAINSFTA